MDILPLQHSPLYILISRLFHTLTPHLLGCFVPVMFVCVGVVSLPAGNIVAAKPNKQAAADYDITGLVAPRSATGSFRFVLGD